MELREFSAAAGNTVFKEYLTMWKSAHYYIVLRVENRQDINFYIL